MRLFISIAAVTSLELAISTAAAAAFGNQLEDGRSRSIRSDHRSEHVRRPHEQQQVAVDAKGILENAARVAIRPWPAESAEGLTGGRSRLRPQSRLGGSVVRTATQKSRSPMLIEQELSSLYEVLADAHNSSTSAESANAFFQHFVQASGLKAELAEDEVANYQKNFVEYLHAATKAVDLRSVSPSEGLAHWTKIAKVCMELAKPLQTEKLVQNINQHALQWQASVQEDRKKMTWFEAALLAGVTEPHNLKNYGAASLDDILPKALDAEWKDDMEQEFDARAHWPECARVFESVKDQGKCGSDWAEAAASLADARLCVATNGEFADRSLSGTYILSCTGGGNINGRNICDGGSPLDAISFLGNHGAPTGGAVNGLHDMCITLNEGPSLVHSEAPQSARPECPNECFNRDYPRSLQADTFKPEGLSQLLVTGDRDIGRLGIKTYGSVLMTFPVFRDFFSYTSGVYTPVSDEHAGVHAVLAIGFGEDYFLAVNSWGEAWGERGLFKLHKDMDVTFYIPGALAGSGEGYPFPLPHAVPIPPGQAAATGNMTFQFGPSAAAQERGEWECKWIQTASCQGDGQPAEVEKACDSNVSLGGVGFCDCDGDSIQDPSEPNYKCTATPGTCLEACTAQGLAPGRTNTADSEKTGSGTKQIAGRFEKMLPGSRCILNSDILSAAMCHAAAAELGLEWGGPISDNQERRYCIYDESMRQIVYNEEGEERKMTSDTACSVCLSRPPNYTYSVVGEGRCEDMNHQAAHPTTLNVTSNPLYNCEALCNSQETCTGFDNRSSGCVIYEDIEIAQAGKDETGSSDHFLCFRRGEQECGMWWDKMQGAPMVEPTLQPSSCECEVKCLIDDRCMAWTWDVNTSHCILHKHETSDGDPCPHGCLVGRIGQRPGNQSIRGVALTEISHNEAQVSDPVDKDHFSLSSFWKLVDGPCKIEDDCILSPGYPEDYEGDQSCTFKPTKKHLKVPSDLHAANESLSGLYHKAEELWKAWANGTKDARQPAYRMFRAHLEVQDFVTERGFDKLTVDGEPFSGVASPHGLPINGLIKWTSDGDVNYRGFHICVNLRPDVEAIKDTPTNWVPPSQIATSHQQLTMWAVMPNNAEANCQIDEHLCISSPGYGTGSYALSSECKIMIAEGVGVRLHVVDFDTETHFDYMLINGQHYSGNDSPDHVEARGVIEWSSDGTYTGSGWKICPDSGYHPGSGMHNNSHHNDTGSRTMRQIEHEQRHTETTTSTTTTANPSRACVTGPWGAAAIASLLLSLALENV